MDEHTFRKVAKMLRPILERNEYYASEKREKCREREREGERIEESRSLVFPIVSYGTAKNTM